MASKLRDNLLYTALAISCSLNCCIIVFGTLGDLSTHMSVLAKVARALATPPGFLFGWLIQPKVQSISAIIIASVEGLIGSIAFYTLVAWVILWLLARRHSSKSGDGQA